jgi:hypothetical protein
VTGLPRPALADAASRARENPSVVAAHPDSSRCASAPGDTFWSARPAPPAAMASLQRRVPPPRAKREAKAAVAAPFRTFLRGRSRRSRAGPDRRGDDPRRCPAAAVTVTVAKKCSWNGSRGAGVGTEMQRGRARPSSGASSGVHSAAIIDRGTSGRVAGMVVGFHTQASYSTSVTDFAPCQVITLIASSPAMTGDLWCRRRASPGCPTSAVGDDVRHDAVMPNEAHCVARRGARMPGVRKSGSSRATALLERPGCIGAGLNARAASSRATAIF